MFGSEVSRFEIAKPMSPALVGALSELIYTYKVLIFRNQLSMRPQELANQPIIAYFGPPLSKRYFLQRMYGEVERRAGSGIPRSLAARLLLKDIL